MHFSVRSSFFASVALSCLAISCASQPEAQVAEASVAHEPKEEEKEVVQWVPGPSPQEIQQVIGTRNPELRQCYLVGTFKNSQLQGTVNVLFTIDTAGKVSVAKDAGSDIDDPEVVDCVLGIFEKIEFARGGSSDTEVEYPVVFGQRG